MVGESAPVPRSKWLKFALNPWTIISSIVLGISFGLLLPTKAAGLGIIGQIYIALLSMCVLPIIITAIISSLGRLLLLGNAGNSIRKLGMLFVFGLFFASLFGFTTAFVLQPGANLSDESRKVVGKMLSDSEMGYFEESTEAPKVLNLLKRMIPNNPFAAASRGDFLAIVFFSILMGLSLGFVKLPSGETTLSVFEALFDASLRLITWVMYGLPFGLFALFAGQVATLGLGVFVALGKFVLVIYAAALIMLATYVIITARATKRPIIRTLFSLKEPFFVALGTSSSFAALPVAMVALRRKLGVPRKVGNLVMPLGVTLNPHGTAMWFAMIAVFMSQLYEVQLGVVGTLFAVFGSMLASLAIAGVPGIAALFMVAIVLDPLGLPTSSAIVLLLAIDPLLDPIVTAVNVMSNCCVTTLAQNTKQEETSQPVDNDVMPVASAS